MKKHILYFVFLFCLIYQKAHCQIRLKGTNYLEVMAGKPLFIDGFQVGEKNYGISYAIGTSRGNYHRLNALYRKEFVKGNVASNYENYTAFYSYERTLAKGRNHLTYVGLLYGAGFGVENLNNTYNTALQSSTAYPLLYVGINLERFIYTGMAVFARIDGNGTTAATSQKIKGDACIGFKIRL
jgi:hypothetical protein